jgi:signal peptidase I
MGKRARSRAGPPREPVKATEGDSTRSKALAALREWGRTLLMTIAFLVIIRAFLVQTYVIISGSMEDSLLVGDFVMVNRLAMGTRIPGTQVRTPGYASPGRGDVVVFDPAHDVVPLVKRLVGMPGDTLRMVDKLLFINGVPQNEPYAKRTGEGADEYLAEMEWQRAFLHPSVDRGEYQPTRDNWGPIVVPEEHFFLLGDNRDGSRDSRYWGLIERWRILGRAMFFYYSYDKSSSAPFAFLREIRWDRIGRAVR